MNGENQKALNVRAIDKLRFMVQKERIWVDKKNSKDKNIKKEMDHISIFLIIICMLLAAVSKELIR